MKILHVGYSDTKGGAAISMMRLHNSLILKNIDSKVLVAEKMTNDPNVIGPTKSIETLINDMKKILVRQKKLIFKNTEDYSHSLNFFKSNIIKKINKINPDLVNLHWVNNELLSIKQIGQIKQPLVWTFVDMWPMCGGEHYTETKRYKEGYSKTNQEKNLKGIDLNRLLWDQKKKNWNHKIKEIVCISEWLKEKTNESSLFKNKRITKINCNIDLKTWKPIEKDLARNVLNFPKNKKLFLFLSTNGVKDTRKGFKFVDKALTKISEQRKDFELVIVGKGNDIGKKKYDYRVIDKIFDGNPIELRLIYSACDLVLSPSTLKAFGQVAVESASCGTPTIGFQKTGFEDIVNHKINGFLSNYLDEEDFYEGVNWFINNTESENKEISQNCLKIVSEKFDNGYIAEKYIKLYKSII